MSSSTRHRLLNGITWNLAWSSSAWLAVMVGCVDAPRENFTPVEAAASPSSASDELVQADLTEEAASSSSGPTNAQVAAEESEPTLASDEDEAELGPGLFPIPEPDTGLEASETSTELKPIVPVAEGQQPEPTPTEQAAPTPVDSVERLAPVPLAEQPAEDKSPEPTTAESDGSQPFPTVPAPFPGAEESVVTLKLDPEPELVSEPKPEPKPELAPQPTPATPEPSAAATADKPAEVAEAPSAAPAPLPPAGQPVVNANANPLEISKPKSYIHINPKPRTPDNASIPSGTVNQNVTGKLAPAVVLPPSSAAEAGVLEPLSEKSSDSQASAAEPSAAEQKPSPVPHGIPVSPVSLSSKESDESPVSEIPEGFTPLFNNQDMTGWEVFDGKVDSWEFKDGVVSCVAPGGGWLQTLAMYSDFELRFEYRLSVGGNSGVSLRYPGQGNPSLEGLEIQLIDDHADKYRDIQPNQATGSLYFAAAPQVRDASHSAGTWNHCIIKCVGSRLDVTINDKLVNEIDLTQINTRVEGVPRTVAATRSPMGAIAFQSHSTRVDFRQVALRDLTQVLTTGVRWLDLQEGTGDAVPPGASVTVHYIGHLATGKRFANSVEKDKPVTVELKDVIPGWREGIPGMKVGGKRRLIVPAELAYGAKGFKDVIPPNSTLVYEIELLEFQPSEDEVPLEAADASTAESEVK